MNAELETTDKVCKNCHKVHEYELEDLEYVRRECKQPGPKRRRVYIVSPDEVLEFEVCTVCALIYCAGGWRVKKILVRGQNFKCDTCGDECEGWA